MQVHQTTPCVHRWVLGEPRMATVRAVCRRCGSHRTYPSGLAFPEAGSEQDDPYRSRLLLSMESAMLEEQTPALVGLSGGDGYGSVAAERI